MSNAPDLKTTITTPRLTMHLVDPENTPDMNVLVSLYTQYLAQGGHPSAATYEDLQKKHEISRPQERFCTRAMPPRGMIHVIYLNDDVDGDDDDVQRGGAPPSRGPNQKTPIGHIILSTRPEMPCPDLGYALLKPFEGKGYAFEAAQAVLKFWQEDVGVLEIWLGTDGENARSMKLAERLGFVRAGTFGVVVPREGGEEVVEMEVAFVLPGMEWREGWVMRPQVPSGVKFEEVVDGEKAIA